MRHQPETDIPEATILMCMRLRYPFEQAGHNKWQVWDTNPDGEKPILLSEHSTLSAASKTSYKLALAACERAK